MRLSNHPGESWKWARATAAGPSNLVRLVGVCPRVLIQGVSLTATAEHNPECAVLGIDTHCLSPTRVVPDNCSFDIASARGYWDFMDGQKADFILQRFIGCLSEYQERLEMMYDNLEVGGWVELHEWVVDFQSFNGSINGTALEQWNSLFKQGQTTSFFFLFNPCLSLSLSIFMFPFFVFSSCSDRPCRSPAQNGPKCFTSLRIRTAATSPRLLQHHPVQSRRARERVES